MLSRALRPRVLVYGAALLAATAAFALGLASRSPFAVDVLRDRGALARHGSDGSVENVYRLQLMNRTEREQRYRIDARGLPGLAVELGDAAPSTAPAGMASATLRLTVPAEAAAALAPGAHRVEFVVEVDGTSSPVREASTFFVPR